MSHHNRLPLSERALWEQICPPICSKRNFMLLCILQNLSCPSGSFPAYCHICGSIILLNWINGTDRFVHFFRLPLNVWRGDDLISSSSLVSISDPLPFQISVSSSKVTSRLTSICLDPGCIFFQPLKTCNIPRMFHSCLKVLSWAHEYTLESNCPSW